MMETVHISKPLVYIYDNIQRHIPDGCRLYAVNILCSTTYGFAQDRLRTTATGNLNRYRLIVVPYLQFSSVSPIYRQDKTKNGIEVHLGLPPIRQLKSFKAIPAKESTLINTTFTGYLLRKKSNLRQSPL